MRLTTCWPTAWPSMPTIWARPGRVAAPSLSLSSTLVWPLLLARRAAVRSASLIFPAPHPSWGRDSCGSLRGVLVRQHLRPGRRVPRWALDLVGLPFGQAVEQLPDRRRPQLFGDRADRRLDDLVAAPRRH